VDHRGYPVGSHCTIARGVISNAGRGRWQNHLDHVLQSPDLSVYRWLPDGPGDGALGPAPAYRDKGTDVFRYQPRQNPDGLHVRLGVPVNVDVEYSHYDDDDPHCLVDHLQARGNSR